MSHRTPLVRIAAAALLAIPASGRPLHAGQDGPAPSAPPAAATPAPASPLPAGHPSTGSAPAAGGLPAGHPAMSSPAPAFEIPPVAEGSGTGENALAWDAPKDWVPEKPANAMRRAQYRVPGAGGEGECVVFYFGPGQGGDPMANAERWAAQFRDAEGKPATSSMTTRTIDVAGIPVLLIEAKGTYVPGGMPGGATGPRPGWALLGAVAGGPDANWFYKLTGPEATLGAQRDSFEKMIRSIRRGAR